MTEQFNGKYGFEPADERCVGECESNSLIIPKLYRYQGMGHWQILAEVNLEVAAKLHHHGSLPDQTKDHPDKFFLIAVGGANGYEQADSHEAVKKLTLSDAITLEQLQTKLKGEFWVEVAKTTEFEGGQVNECVDHQGEN